MYFKRKRSMRIAIVVTAALVLPFLLTQVASATTYTPTDLATCAAIPGAVSWDGATNTCTLGAGTLTSGNSIVVSSGITLNVSAVYTVDSGASITVNSGGTLLIPSGGDLENWGTLTISSGGVGTVISGLLADDSTGSMTINGALTISSTTGYFYVDGSVVITGSGSSLAIEDCDFGLYIDVGGSVDSDTGATLSVSADGCIENYGSLETTGTGVVTSYGGFYSYDSAEVTNAAGGTMTNAGTMYLEDSSVLYNYGTFNENGYLEVDESSVANNFGTFNLPTGAEVEVYNTGDLYNNGNLNVNGGKIVDWDLFYNDISGVVTISSGEVYLSVYGFATSTNKGSIVNYDYIEIDGGFVNEGVGTFDNYDWFANYGDVTNVGAVDNEVTNSVIDNYATADFDNSLGTISNAGALPYYGIFNYCTATFEIGTLSGNPVQFLVCDPVITGPASASTETPTITGNMGGWFSSGGGTSISIDLLDAAYNFVASGLATGPSGDWSIVYSVPLAAGPHTLYALATDAQGYYAYSLPASLDVVLPTMTTLACTPTPLDVGTATSCTVTVEEEASGSGTLVHTSPTGTVSLTGSPAGIPASTSCTLASTGVAGQSQCTAAFTPSALGTSTVTAMYGGKTDYWTGSSGTYGVFGDQLGSSISFSCGALVVNKPVTCTATVSDEPTAVIPPGGSNAVTFSWSGTGSFSPSAMCTPAGSGDTSKCSVTFTPTEVGTYDMTASYAGDGLHTAATPSTTALTVGKRSVSVAVSCPTKTANKKAFTCTITVSDASSGTKITPVGTVTVTLTGPSSTTLSCKLVGGTCTVTYTPEKTGTYTVKASYPGDADHLAATAKTTVKVT